MVSQTLNPGALLWTLYVGAVSFATVAFDFADCSSGAFGNAESSPNPPVPPAGKGGLRFILPIADLSSRNIAVGLAESSGLILAVVPDALGDDSGALGLTAIGFTRAVAKAPKGFGLVRPYTGNSDAKVATAGTLKGGLGGGS